MRFLFRLVALTRKHYAISLQRYELEQHPIGMINPYLGLAWLVVSQAKSRYPRAFTLAEQLDLDHHPIIVADRQELIIAHNKVTVHTMQTS